MTALLVLFGVKAADDLGAIDVDDDQRLRRWGANLPTIDGLKQLTEDEHGVVTAAHRQTAAERVRLEIERGIR